jgi:hypothetical protein
MIQEIIQKLTTGTAGDISICGQGPAALSSKEQSIFPNYRFWRDSLGPQAPPESVNPSKAKNGPFKKF